MLLLDLIGYHSCSCSFLFTLKVIFHTTIPGSFLLPFITAIAMPAQTLEWTKSLTKLKAKNLMKNDQHFESMESPWANENPPGQPSFLKACWLLELFPFCSSIIMQYAFGSTDSSCAEVQGDALPRRADLQNRQALAWIEPCSGLNTFPFILPLRPSFICPLCPSCPFSKSFFFLQL